MPDTFIEICSFISWKKLTTGYLHLQLESKKLSTIAEPGHYLEFDHCLLPEPAKFYIMRNSQSQHQLECLAKISDDTDIKMLPDYESITCTGVYGENPNIRPDKSFILILAQDQHLASAVFLSDRLRNNTNLNLFVMLEISSKPPFPLRPSEFIIPEIPSDALACVPLLEDWNVLSRIASQNMQAGCYCGDAQQLAQLWLSQLKTCEQHDVQIVCFGDDSFKQQAQALKRD